MSKDSTKNIFCIFKNQVINIFCLLVREVEIICETAKICLLTVCQLYFLIASDERNFTYKYASTYLRCNFLRLHFGQVFKLKQHFFRAIVRKLLAFAFQKTFSETYVTKSFYLKLEITEFFYLKKFFVKHSFSFVCA